MNDEVKEILDRLNNIPMNELYACCLEDSECKIILDYITNLQEENEDLKDRLKVMEHFKNSLQEENEKLKELCAKYEEEHNTAFKLWTMKMEEIPTYEEKETLKLKGEKAIEYIKVWQSFPHTNGSTHNELKNLLNILGGDE